MMPFSKRADQMWLGAKSLCLFAILISVLLGCVEESDSQSGATEIRDMERSDAYLVFDARVPDAEPFEVVDQWLETDAEGTRLNDMVVDAEESSLRAFSVSEADAKIEMDCSGCHEAGGTGSSRRLGWDNMSYQLVYLSVKDPWTASGSRMPLQGEYWSNDDIERLRLLVVSMGDD